MHTYPTARVPIQAGSRGARLSIRARALPGMGRSLQSLEVMSLCGNLI